MSLTRVQQLLLAVVILAIVGALAVGVYGRTVGRGAPAPVYTPPRTPPLPPAVIVHVAGEVNRPGLHELPRGARVQDAVQAAGGFTPAADRQAVNLAAPLEDGERIAVPRAAPILAPATASTTSKPAAGLLNLNTASTDELAELPGIGPGLAGRIVLYRTQNGPFRSIEALEAVPGIGPKRLAQVRPYVTVR